RDHPVEEWRAVMATITKSANPPALGRRSFLRTAAAASGLATLGVGLRGPAYGDGIDLGAGEPGDGVLPAWAKQYAPSVSGPFDAATGVFNWRPSGLKQNVTRTKESLTGAFSRDQHHLFVGDSI